MAEKKERIVPDTSVLINRIISELVVKEELKDAEIIVPEFVLGELQAQASRGQTIGILGLGELKHLAELSERGIKISYKGRKQTMEEIRLAKSGRVDALIVDVAKEEDAILYTCDMIQNMVAEVQGVKTRYFKPYEKLMQLKVEGMMTPDTLSLHLKEGALPMAKRGKPGNFKLLKIAANPMTADEINAIIKEIMDAVRYEDNGFIEMGDHEATVVQLGNLRIAIARPPFSDGTEVTIVRPIVKLTLEDYKIKPELKERIMQGSGIILAGPPGSGKSTLAASIAEFYEESGFIVKTLEQPRDLQVRKEITQYGKLKGDFERTAELLLLVRPDYTIYDEVRTTRDFNVFTDMRLSGIGMVGVVHANAPIDAIQRFIRRLELGMIPHVIDTIVFVSHGEISKVYKLSLEVRTPTGMTEADLARPVVNIKDFFTNDLEYEIYTYGEENVIIPIAEKAANDSIAEKLAKERIKNEIRKFDKNAEVELSRDRITIKVDNDSIARIIGKKGSTIQELERILGARIEVMPKIATLKKEVGFNPSETGGYFVLSFDKQCIGKTVNIYSDSDFIMTAVVGSKAQIKISKESEIGEAVMKAMVSSQLKVFI
jgi:ATPase